jgi:tetratricopeptide (TPR) repeat protein
MSTPPAERPSRRLLISGLVILVLLLSGALFWTRQGPKSANQFIRLTNTGKNYYDQGQADKAVAAFEQALKLNPTHPDALLNLANACLLANRAEDALKFSQEILNLDHNSAAGHYLMGCAYLRLGKFTEAVQALQQAKDIDRTINAVSFQLGRAHKELGHFEAALQEFQEVVQFEPDHPAAYYNLSQALIRLGRTDEANQALETHRKLMAAKPNQSTDPSAYERCKYTQVRLPFQLEQPAPRGIRVTFADATAAFFGGDASKYRGPIGVLDLQHDGRNGLFLLEPGQGFRFLINSNRAFHRFGDPLPSIADAKYAECLVGDLNNDQAEDVIVLGEQGSHVFKFTTNGAITDITRFARLDGLTASRGALLDLDFTGKLDLFALGSGTNGVRVLRNLGHPYFTDITATSGAPASVSGARQVFVDDWNGDDLLDVFITREGQPPLLLTKVRGGPLTATNSPSDWPTGAILAAGDLNNDLRSDLIMAGDGKLEFVFGGLPQRTSLPLGTFSVRALKLLDYDNDGWLDVLAGGSGLRVWRNLGQAGFREMTRELGLEARVKGAIDSLAAADFDQDCDTDLLLVLDDQTLQLLRNDGGNANHQLKARLIGTRSNASGLGIRLDVSAGGLRLARRVNVLPVEIGVGRNAQLDSLIARWFNLNLNNVDVRVDPCAIVTLFELQIQDGSCPFLYSWDGKRFRFVTDLLGAAPLGLRVSEHRFVEADTQEYVWIGNETMCPPRDGHHVLQVTEELREVLYLDEAKLVVVDHPPDTEVHTTGKLVPDKPFPAHEIVTLRRRRPLLAATNLAGQDVAPLLREADRKHVSPQRLRVPQLRGLAEPHGVTLDFGPLPVDRPLVLALTGWLRFGGGMANVAASHDPDLPFPFPTLEAERAVAGTSSAQDSQTGSVEWQPVKVVVGAPAGKTKTILVDLTGKLPPGARRLRLSTAFEIHWDRIALFEKRDNADTAITVVAPASADLHWRGFSEYQDWPWHLPLTPDYERVKPSPPWRITPVGWCTRYGPVEQLIARSDQALALLNGGDELTLKFAADRLPSKRAGLVRDFFFYSVGWDKDADFHCELGWQVEPLPWHGLDDQLYGRQPRPSFPNDGWMEKYNTRWVGPKTLARGK